jgi:hypothetical protein
MVTQVISGDQAAIRTNRRRHMRAERVHVTLSGLVAISTHRFPLPPSVQLGLGATRQPPRRDPLGLHIQSSEGQVLFHFAAPDDGNAADAPEGTRLPAAELRHLQVGALRALLQARAVTRHVERMIHLPGPRQAEVDSTWWCGEVAAELSALADLLLIVIPEHYAPAPEHHEPGHEPGEDALDGQE